MPSLWTWHVTHGYVVQPWSSPHFCQPVSQRPKPVSHTRLLTEIWGTRHSSSLQCDFAKFWTPHFLFLDSTLLGLDSTFWLDSTLKLNYECPVLRIVRHHCAQTPRTSPLTILVRVMPASAVHIAVHAMHIRSKRGALAHANQLPLPRLWNAAGLEFSHVNSALASTSGPDLRGAPRGAQGARAPGPPPREGPPPKPSHFISGSVDTHVIA